MIQLEQFKADVAGNPYTEIVRIRYLTGSVSDTDFDDAQVLTKSGNDTWISGMAFPIKATKGSTDAFLLEQGKIETNDKKIFIAGDTETTDVMKIGLGSPTHQEHAIIEKGVITFPPSPSSNPVFKILYCKELSLGSYIGEI